MTDKLREAAQALLATTEWVNNSVAYVDADLAIALRDALAEPNFYVLDLFKTGDGSYMENGLEVTFKDGRLVAVKDFTRPSIDTLIAEILSAGVNNHTAIQAILDKYRGKPC